MHLRVCDFNPRSSYEERRGYDVIRFPLESFQSTLLIRGATAAVDTEAVLLPISIHAPHTRSDAAFADDAVDDGEFQSTLLIRGATFCSTGGADKVKDFNPRSSYEERRPYGLF